MNRALGIAACAMLLVLPAVAQKGGAQKTTTSTLPIVNSISPSSKEAGSGAFILTVTGSNFTTGSVARWNGTAISTGFVSSTQLSATVGSSLIASTGTSSVTVYTSGRKGGTSNTLTFTITTPTVTAPPPPPPPPPAPSPLSITTSSLPAATANASFNSNVAATGGVPAYGWALVNGGGTLPPGLTLQTNGTISGTPSQAGTFTFTTQAADSASQIAQRVLSITVAADPSATTTPPPTTTGGTILFQSGFEEGTLPGGWGVNNNSTDNTITSTPPPGRSGKALQMHYKICGASDGTCGGSSQDTNRWVSKVITPGLDHFFMRGYVYFKQPEPGIVATNQVQRKLIWIGDSTTASSNVQGGYQLILSSWMGPAINLPTLSLVGQFMPSGPCPAPMWQIYNVYSAFNWNTWYSIEFEMLLNTPGQLDGQTRVWINGTKVYDNSAMNLRGACTTPISFFSVGEQANRYSYNAIDEYRYWDDVVISTGYIGP